MVRRSTNLATYFYKMVKEGVANARTLVLSVSVWTVSPQLATPKNNICNMKIVHPQH